MRVDEGERRVARERNPLPRRLEGRRAGRGRGKREGARERQDAGAVGVRLDEVGDGLKPRLESVRLARLNEAEMALGQRDFFVARQRADHGDAERLDGLRDQSAVALAADAVDHDARDREARVVGRAALDDGRRRLRLPAHVENQQNRHAEGSGDVRRGAAAPALRWDAVEEPHRGFAERERASPRRLRRERRETRGLHRPGVEVDAFAPRRRGVEGRIDIVRAGLQADHVDAAPPERAQEPERNSRLAAARARRGDHEPAGHAIVPTTRGDLSSRANAKRSNNAPYPLIAQALANGPVTPWARLALASAVTRSASVSGSPTRGSTAPNFCIVGSRVL